MTKRPFAPLFAVVLLLLAACSHQPGRQQIAWRVASTSRQDDDAGCESRVAGEGAQAAALAPPRNIDGDRPTRIRSQVETRAGTCERGVALWRVLIASVAEDDALKDRVRISRERTIERLEIMYRPELSTLSDQEHKHMLIALEAITDIESWARMRELHGLSFDRACDVWISAIDRMLPPTPQAA